MERWGAFLDLDLRLDAAGVVFVGPGAERQALQALGDLRLSQPDMCLSLGLGSLAFQRQLRLGAGHWNVEGPGKELAVKLHPLAHPGQCLVLEKDYPLIRNLVQVQVLGQTFPAEKGSAAHQVLNLLAVPGKM